MGSPRRDPKKNGAASDTTSVGPPPPPPQVERITWGKLKLRYLPLERRLKFIKPDDDDEG
jgi:hypothetical protein